MSEERRKSHHIAVNAFVRYYEEPFDPTIQQHRQGVVKNYSKGGMCILTDHPLPKGRVVTVELAIESEMQEMTIIEVRGIVRWVHRMEGRPGMGIEFFEFKDAENEDFDEWMANLFIKEE